MSCQELETLRIVCSREISINVARVCVCRVALISWEMVVTRSGKVASSFCYTMH